MITDKFLIDAYKRGLIPGPYEDEIAFFKRLSNCRDLGFCIKQPLFGFFIDWVPIVISNKNLLPWEGAAVWISQQAPVQIQLRKTFLRTSFFLKDKSEFLAHEAVHAARCQFEEPQFEEVLAYQTSKSCFRKFWGPLFQSSKESTLFMITFIASFVSHWLFSGPFYLLALAFIGCLIYRLLKKQHIFKKCLKKTSYPFMLCLKDEEIKRFSRMPRQDILSDIQQKSSLRHHLLRVILSALERKECGDACDIL